MEILHYDLVRHLQAMVRERAGIVLFAQHAGFSRCHINIPSNANHCHEPDVLLGLFSQLRFPAWEGRKKAIDVMVDGSNVAGFYAHHDYYWRLEILLITS